MSMQMWRKRKEKGGRWGGEERGGGEEDWNQPIRKAIKAVKAGLVLHSRDPIWVKWFWYEVDPWTQLQTFCGFGLARVTPSGSLGSARGGFGLRFRLMSGWEQATGHRACKLSSFEFSKHWWVHSLVQCAVDLVTAQTKEGAPSNCRSIRNDLPTVLYCVGPLGEKKKPLTSTSAVTAEKCQLDSFNKHLNATS